MGLLKKKAMNIGIITYRKYEERVLLNRHFSTDGLFIIILNDPEYRKFQVVDGQERLLLSTDYSETGNGAEYISVAKVERVVEITGTTYDAYRTPSTVHRTKVTWKVGSGIHKTKKDAEAHVAEANRRAREVIERLVDRLPG